MSELAGETTDVRATVLDWLRRFERALSSGTGIADLFQPDAWWRDLLVITDDLRTFQGSDTIAANLKGEVSGLTVSDASHAPDGSFVQASITFRTPVHRAEGILRLTTTDGHAWRAWTLLTAARELVGREEATGRRRPHGAEARTSGGPTWAQTRAREREFLDDEPDVVVVGAGHSGLGLAARLTRMGVRTLVVDHNDRVGDNWRRRYDSLRLHDPVWYDHLPYLPFPPSWPVFTPKDKLADWLEHYVAALDLDVWTGTSLTAATHDGSGWDLVLRRTDRSERRLRPRHLVLATGVSGTEARVPEIPGADDFAGTLCHSSTFPGGAGFATRRAVVVGAGNSAHDIAQDLAEHGARVTMLQRFSTYVVSAEASAMAMAGLYDETGPATEVADLLGASMPWPAAGDAQRAMTARKAEKDSDLLAGLGRAGFRLNDGIDGTGALMLFLQKGGGYYIDVGCSGLIADGTITVRPGADITRLTPTGVRLSDDSELEADVVVLATGYHGMVETARSLLGDEIADRCGPVWGLDPEGELRGVWRRTGQPGLWFMGGNLAMARFYGRFLALQLAADL
ncbi:putative flavoprotein involved in K+ transport [Pseudonocardia ammonioxydans]|uniref:Putative flavoprotein involved in K+ transport n=1 Tax=Pseudonocardia ammonioxydans TaxID=260086 RepID=A0A1I5E1U7_PSUAM|nr:NAD(P)/FAD-dependent oxidoreductase [Pseudonocardia ammonioxydans]SFO05484.1 putative flavoprotein involved in K+ transport [Pseudonocardia ammonioxydans]